MRRQPHTCINRKDTLHSHECIAVLICHILIPIIRYSWSGRHFLTRIVLIHYPLRNINQHIPAPE